MLVKTASVMVSPRRGVSLHQTSFTPNAVIFQAFPSLFNLKNQQQTHSFDFIPPSTYSPMTLLK